MDWIHCNSCYLLPIQSKNKKFSLTSCGHVYCEGCIKPGSTKKCAICGITFTMVTLTADLSPDIQEYFTKPEDILKRALNIMTFQAGHRIRVTAYYNSVITKYKAAKQEIMRLNSVIKKQDKDIKELKQQFILYKQRVHGGTPSPSCSKSSSNINSQIPSSKHLLLSSQINLSPIPVVTPMNSGLPASGIAFSQHSKRPSSRVSPWMTPTRLTLRKLTPPNSGSLTSPGTSHINSFSPLTQWNAFNYSTQYRANMQYPSQPNTPSTPGTLPDTPESANMSPLGRHDFQTPPPTSTSRGISSSSSLSRTNKMLNNLSLAMQQSRGK